MDAYPANRLPSALGLLERETGMFLATVDSLSTEELEGPSKREGWTLGHVVTYATRRADTMARLVDAAVNGTEPSADSAAGGVADLDAGAARPAARIKEDLHEACERFAAAAQTLRGDLAQEDVTLDSATVPARSLVALRTAEVVVQHDRLATVWEFDEADPEAQFDTVEEALRRLEAAGNTPGFVVRTYEKDEWTVAGGGPVVKGERAAILRWLADGDTDGLTVDGETPAITTFH